jgi:magnesium transporter
VIEAVVFDEAGSEELDVAEAAGLREAKSQAGTTWVRATDATADELDSVADAFDLHALTVEDVLGDVRPKTETFDDYTFVLVKDADLRRGDQVFAEEIALTPVGCYIGDDWLVTCSLEAVPAVDRVWSRVLEADQRVLHRGPDYAASRVIDLLVDEYFGILDELETDIERIEDEVTASTGIDVLERINAVRRDLLAFRKVAWPTREALAGLARGDDPFVREANEKYFRDVADHLVQVVDLVETYRDLVGGARDIYLNTLSQSTNEVMKTLTVVATIFIPLTFVAGVYGMNFATEGEVAVPGLPDLNMPELGWQFGYPAAMVGMALIAAVMLLHFRRREWI